MRYLKILISLQQYHQIIDHKNVQDNTKVTEIWNNSFKRSNKSRNKTNAALKGTRTLCSDNRLLFHSKTNINELILCLHNIEKSFKTTEKAKKCKTDIL